MELERSQRALPVRLPILADTQCTRARSRTTERSPARVRQPGEGDFRRILLANASTSPPRVSSPHSASTTVPRVTAAQRRTGGDEEAAGCISREPGGRRGMAGLAKRILLTTQTKEFGLLDRRMRPSKPTVLRSPQPQSPPAPTMLAASPSAVLNRAGCSLQLVHMSREVSRSSTGFSAVK